MAHQLPKLLELNQREVFTDEMGHPVVLTVPVVDWPFTIATYSPGRMAKHPISKSMGGYNQVITNN